MEKWEKCRMFACPTIESGLVKGHARLGIQDYYLGTKGIIFMTIFQPILFCAPLYAYVMINLCWFLFRKGHVAFKRDVKCWVVGILPILIIN